MSSSRDGEEDTERGARMGTRLWMFTVKAMPEYREQWDELVARHGGEAKVVEAVRRLRGGTSMPDDPVESDLRRLSWRFRLGAYGPVNPNDDKDGLEVPHDQEQDNPRVLAVSRDAKRAVLEIDWTLPQKKLGKLIYDLHLRHQQRRAKTTDSDGVDRDIPWEQAFRMVVASLNNPDLKRDEQPGEAGLEYGKETAGRTARRYVNTYLPTRLAHEVSRLHKLWALEAAATAEEPTVLDPWKIVTEPLQLQPREIQLLSVVREWEDLGPVRPVEL